MRLENAGAGMEEFTNNDVSCSAQSELLLLLLLLLLFSI